MKAARRLRTLLPTWLVLAAVAIVAVFATLDALRRPASEPRDATRTETGRLVGDRLPESAVLSGTLFFAGQSSCRPQALRLDTLTLARAGPPVECGLWVPPRGDFAAVSLAPALALRGSRLGLLRLGDPPTVVRRLGVARGEPSWSADGARLAWCTEESETVVLDVEGGATARLEGCRPRFAPDGSLLTRPNSLLATSVLRDGQVLLGEDELARPFPPDAQGPLDVVGYGARADGLLAVVVVRFESGRRPRRMLELWRGKELEQAILLPELGLPAGYGRLGERVEFDPTGREVAVSFSGAGREMVLVDLARGGVVTLEPTSQHGFAWSPDGTWLALSTGAEIQVLGPGRGESEYVLPVGAAALAWR